MMNAKKFKLLFLILIPALLISCFAGCGKTTDVPAEDATPAPTETAPADTDDSAEADAEAAARFAKYKVAYNKYSPDTVVLTVNNVPVLWSEFFSWLYDFATQLENAYDITDWSAEFPELVGYTADPSYGAYVLSMAVTNCLQIAVLNSKAEEMNVSLSAEQQADLDSTMEQYYNYFGGKEGFREFLASAFLTEEYFRKQNTTMLVYNNLFEAHFGKDGCELPDEDALLYLSDAGYMHAKHILFKTIDNNRQPLDEATIAEKKAQAEDVLAQLQACPTDQFSAKFDELMKEHSEDEGLVSNPDGYYFRSGEMVASFEEATKALAENEMSGIVESPYGYHIILRTPMSPDDIIDYTSQYEPITPRTAAATALFGGIANEWFFTAKVVYESDFETLDMNALFAE